MGEFTIFLFTIKVTPVRLGSQVQQIPSAYNRDLPPGFRT